MFLLSLYCYTFKHDRKIMELKTHFQTDKFYLLEVAKIMPSFNDDSDNCPNVLIEDNHVANQSK